MAKSSTPPQEPTPAPINARRVFRSAYSPRVRVAISFDGPGLTKQSFKDECDINVIMARYLKTGSLDFISSMQAQYGDVTGYEFQDAMNLVADAKSMFAELPSAIRARFDNQPGLLLDFLNDEKNRDEAVALGLVKAPSAKPAVEPVVTQAAQAASTTTPSAAQ